MLIAEKKLKIHSDRHISNEDVDKICDILDDIDLAGIVKVLMQDKGLDLAQYQVQEVE